MAREIVVVQNKKKVTIVIKEEHKNKSVGVAMTDKTKDEPKCVSIGAAPESVVEQSNRIIAQRCIMGFIQIKHPEISKNSDANKNAVLNQVIATGDMSYAKEYIGFPLLLSNKYHDPNNS